MEKDKFIMTFTSKPKPKEGENSCSQEFIDFLIQHLIGTKEVKEVLWEES